ncbi:TolC family protein [Flavilitoribacter nigricans]|nr:TolC family protein [Flavilitoribacter nigricans]
MKQSGKRLGFALVMLWMVTGLSAQPNTVSLEDAISYAINNSTSTQNARLNISDAEAQIIERRSTGLPQLNGSVNFQHYLKVPVQPLPENFQTFGVVFADLMPYLSESTRQLLLEQNSGDDSGGVAFVLKNNLTASLNLESMIFDGSYFVGLQAARAYRKYAAVDLAVKEREVRNQVIDAYYPVLLVDENLELLEKNITNLERLHFETEELYKAGFAEQLDVDRLELSLTNLQTERDNLLRQKELAIAGLKFAMNYPQDSELEVTGDLDEMIVEAPAGSLTDAVNFQRRPEIGLIDEALQLNELNIRVNKMGYLPSLRGFATYQQSYFGNDLKNGFWAPAAFVGLTLNVPIFDGFNKKAKIQRAQLDLEEAINQRNELVQAISFEVESARTSYMNAQERLANQQKNLELAERIYQTTQVKYREGVGSSLEVSQAEQSLYTTQSNYMQAMYDLVVARANLEKALNIQ